jgi:hypothetical protein
VAQRQCASGEEAEPFAERPGRGRRLGGVGVGRRWVAPLAALRQLGERNSHEFSISRTDANKKAGGLMLTLKKADPNKNRYTTEAVSG